jgi:hypothetical protein
MTVVLLASFSSVREGRDLRGKQRWNSSYKRPGVNNVIKLFLGSFFESVALLLNKVLKAVFRRLFWVKYSFDGL